MGDSDWVVRDGVREDESCIVPMWIKQLVKGDEAKGARRKGASPSWSDDEFLAFYAEMHPIIEGVLRSGVTVRVACDPERVHESDGQRAIIHAWAVTDGDVLYGVGIDKRFMAAGFGADLQRAVLGDALTRPMRLRLDVIDVKTYPHGWTRERGWSAPLRALSARRLAADATFASVAAHVLDDARTPWLPREKRSAA
jgi:hypothetical protein